MLGDAAEPASRVPMARPIAAGRGWAINDVVCRLEPQDRPYSTALRCAIAIPRPRTQPGSANWADTFNVAIAATQEIPARTQAIKPVAGSRAMANRTSASAVPTVAPLS